MRLRALVAGSMLLAMVAPGAMAAPAPPGEPQEETEASEAAVDPRLFETLEYRFVGPTRGGRSTAVAGIPSEPRTFYMGTTGGGVWKTLNAGLSWENVSDDAFGVGSIGAVEVALADPNVVYVGTGSACPRGNVSVGDGMYRSTDAGRSWSHVGLPDAGQIGRVRVHPRNPDLVYVAALGSVFGPNEERGVYRSRDGGDSWEKVLFISERTGVVDLAMSPGNPRVLFAAAWTAERKPWTLVDGSEESGLYRSTDGGDGWERVEGGFPGGVLGRIGVTVSPADPARVWALVTAEGDRGGVWRSDDGGDSWRRISGDRELQTRGWYYSHITADPVDPDTVYAMNAGFFRSVDGGASWDRVGTPHGDNHDLWIHPNDPDLFIEANDGGAAVTFDGGATWTTQLNQPTAEFYRVTVDDARPYRIYGAQQDNSTISVPSMPGSSAVFPFDWYTVGGGESGHIAVKPGDPNTVFSGNYIGQIDRFDRASGHASNVVIYPQMQDGTAPRDLRYRFQWNAPIVFSRHDPEAIYHTSNFVHRSRDGGQSWETISPDLTRDDPEQQALPGGPVQHDHTGVEVYNTVFALAESPHVAGELWAGSDDGRVHVTRDDGATWIDVTPAGLPVDSTVNVIELSTHEPDRAWVAAYRYRSDDWAPYVFRTDDGGASWRLMTDGANGIPGDHPVRALREDSERDGLVYAGTEFGMFVSFDGGERWQSLQLNLPVTPITDLVVHRGDLVVATQGRSFWVLDELTVLRQVTPALAESELALLRPDATVRWATRGRSRGDGPRAAPWGVVLHYWVDAPDHEGPASEAPDDAAGSDGSPGGADEAAPLRLEILDSDGAILREYRSDAVEEAGERRGRRSVRLPAEPGMNRFVWPFAVEGPDTLDDARFSLAFTGDYPVPPGVYRARLTHGEAVQEQELVVEADPRMAVAADDLEAQYALQAEVKMLLEEAHGAVRRLRSVRAQVEVATKRAEQAGIEGEWAADREAVIAALDELEDELIQHRSEASQDPINFPPRLDDQIAYLYSHVAEGYGRPTRGAHQRLADLRAELRPLTERLRQLLETRVADLDERLQAAGVAGVLLPGREHP